MGCLVGTRVAVSEVFVCLLVQVSLFDVLPYILMTYTNASSTVFSLINWGLKNPGPGIVVLTLMILFILAVLYLIVRLTCLQKKKSAPIYARSDSRRLIIAPKQFCNIGQKFGTLRGTIRNQFLRRKHGLGSLEPTTNFHTPESSPLNSPDDFFPSTSRSLIPPMGPPTSKYITSAAALPNSPPPQNLATVDPRTRALYEQYSQQQRSAQNIQENLEIDTDLGDPDAEKAAQKPTWASARGKK